MTAAESDALLQLLDKERDALLAAVDREPAAQRCERPAQDRWSLAEILEHIARVDSGVVRIIALRAAEPRTASAEELERARVTPTRIHFSGP